MFAIGSLLVLRPCFSANLFGKLLGMHILQRKPLFSVLSGLVIFASCLLVPHRSEGQSLQKPPIDIATAKSHFAEAATLFEEDGGALWGTSLAGPIIFVDRDTHIAIANQADSQNTLLPVDGVFSGRLLSNVMIANTAIDWNETKWTMLVWPLPENADERRVLLAHEAWHRIQEALGFPMSGAANAHLNSLNGRYLLQLEWRALGVALQSKGDQRMEAISDALHFRFRRQQLVPGCETEEQGMELNEGLAEYTGVRLALAPAERISRTVVQLKNRPGDFKTFVRSFAYLSGPAYGLLLDELDPDWLKNVSAKSDLAKLLQEGAQIEVETDLETAVTERAPKFNGQALWTAEKKRDDERLAQISSLTNKYTAGPRLIIPLEKMNMFFDPTELIPLGNSGTFYPTLTITDRWGVLTATGGALISSDFREVSVSVPAEYANALKTTDWELELNKGWSIRAAAEHVFRIGID